VAVSRGLHERCVAISLQTKRHVIAQEISTENEKESADRTPKRSLGLLQASGKGTQYNKYENPGAMILHICSIENLTPLSRLHTIFPIPKQTSSFTFVTKSEKELHAQTNKRTRTSISHNSCQIQIPYESQILFKKKRQSRKDKDTSSIYFGIP